MGNRAASSSIAAVLTLAVACGPSIRAFPYLAPMRGDDRGTSFAPLGDALVAAIARGQPDRARPAAPIALTSSDGRGLALERIAVEAVIDGPIALTELHLSFRNPEDRELEGRFTITLPPGAAVSRFAMKNEGWREAEVVPRVRAREVYEDYLHRKVDPALLEQSAGNTFSARVFPIAANASKEIVLAYSQEVSAVDPYRVRLGGLPRVDELTWSVALDGVVQAHRQADVVPADVAVDAGLGAAAVVAGAAFVVRVTPPADAVADPITDVVILVDTSASRARVLRRQAELVRALIDELATRDRAPRITVLAFDQGLEPIADGPAAEVGARVRDRLIARGALGASDLGTALAAIPRGARVILVSDGVATIGERDAGALAAIVRGRGVTRLDAVTVGGVEDREVLRALTAAGERGGAVRDGERPALLAGLERRMLGDVSIAVDGARWVWPATLAGLAAGQPVVVAGERRGRGDVSIGFTVAGGRPTTVAVPAGAGAAPLVERAVARAQIAKVGESLRDVPAGDPRRAAARAQIAALGQRHRLVTAETSLLVLETDADYARFCLRRDGLSDLLTVEAGALRVVDRSPDGSGASPTTPCHVADEPPAGARATPAVSDTTGAVMGVILDQATREALAGATVVVGTGRAQRAEITDDEGWFAMGGLAPGRLTLTIYFADSVLERAVTIEAGRVTDLGGARARVGGPVPGRAFEAVVGAVAGSQADGTGVAFAGSTSIESSYVVDGISIDTGRSRGEMITISSRAPIIDPTSTRLGITIGNQHPSPTWFGDHDEAPAPPPPPPAYTGRFLAVMEHLRAARRDEALREALAWQVGEPTELAAILALGEALEARGAVGLAARAYGSIIDLWPGQAELVRHAGERLDRLGVTGRDLALDAYRRAQADRPDHVTTYRLLAWTLVRAGRFDDATGELERAVARARRDSVRALLRDELGVVAAAWVKAEPARRAELAHRLARRGASIADRPSLRLVLSWETDANDVDLHVRDRTGGHAWFQERRLASGGVLSDDLTDGYGPEVFTIDGAPRGGPYRVQVHYYDRGPMGLGLGTLQIVRHDGAGGVTVDDRPFVIMNDGAYADLGTIE